MSCYRSHHRCNESKASAFQITRPQEPHAAGANCCTIAAVPRAAATRAANDGPSLTAHICSIVPMHRRCKGYKTTHLCPTSNRREVHGQLSRHVSHTQAVGASAAVALVLAAVPSKVGSASRQRNAIIEAPFELRRLVHHAPLSKRHKFGGKTPCFHCRPATQSRYVLASPINNKTQST